MSDKKEDKKKEEEKNMLYNIELLKRAFPPTPSLFSSYEIYHENSKLRRYDQLERSNKKKKFDHSPYKEVIHSDEKTFWLCQKIPLPSVSEQSFFDRATTIKDDAVAKFMNIEDLSKILYPSHAPLPTFKKGVVHLTADLNSIEVYLLVFDIINLPSGVYHYRAKIHSLEELPYPEISKVKMNKICKYLEGKTEVSQDPSVMAILTGVFRRSTAVYSERGYRYTLLQGGCIAERLRFAANLQGFRVQIVEAFLDDKVNDLLNVDGVNESVLCLLAIGI
jgi:SagB-type dehydrogenase family enzyme